VSDLDSPWKEALDRYFEPFLALLFPAVHREIDWARGYEPLDKELQQVVRDAELGRRLADKLVKVWRMDGQDEWILVHVEVQGQEESAFAQRMYVYHYRIFDRYGRRVISLAVLADDRPGWRPDHYGYEVGGCVLSFRFPAIKLLDYAAREAVLEASANPFAAVVLAHLKAQQTRHDAAGRCDWKLRLVRGLYERGFGRQDILELFRLIDWLLELPPELERHFRVEVERYEGERMPYVTSIERLARQEGKQEGFQEGEQKGLRAAVELGLKLKFGTTGLELVPLLQQASLEMLQTLYKGLDTDLGLDELRRLVESAGPTSPGPR
jgi:hypothetical protein